MNRRAFLAALLIFAAAAWLRLPDLADRPMHADEDVYAYKLGEFLQAGRWFYESGDYHGPLLHYVTYAVARSSGATSYRDLTEPILRGVPAVLGVAVTFSPLLLIPALGRSHALISCAFLAVSPTMVYYSRYYIPETLLVFLTACLIWAGLCYTRAPGFRWACVAGLLAGLMFVTKETAATALACIAVAAAASGLRPKASHAAAALVIACAVAAIVLGPAQTLDAMRTYAGRAFQDQRHIHPWHYYLRILLQTWDAPLMAAGAAGAVYAIAGRHANRAVARGAAVYAVAMVAIYSALPYKTPWCILGAIHALALSVASGLERLPRRVAAIAAGACLVLMTLQAWRLSRELAAEPANPLAYAHTGRAVFQIRDRVGTLAAAHEAGANMPVQVIAADNVWPLPWYLRSLPKVEWRRAVADDMQAAPVILATPEMEPALLRHLYEVRPPGRRPLYVPLFPEYTELRPGLELRGYVAQSLAARE